MVFELIHDLDQVNGALPAGHRATQPLRLLRKALLQEVLFVAQHPTALFQSLWNSCWWHEEPLQRPAATAVDLGDSISNERPLRPLVESWRAARDRGGITPWLRSLRPPDTPLDSAPLFVLRGFDGRLFSIAFSKNGLRIATASGEHCIRIWDTRFGQEVLTLKGHEDVVTSIAYLDDDRLVSASADATLRIWNTQSGESTRVLRGHENKINAMAVASAASRVVSGADDGIVIVWDLDSPAPSFVIRAHDTPVAAVACALDGQLFASAAANDSSQAALDKTVRIWDGRWLGEPIAALRHPAEVRALAFSPRGDEIATGAADGVICLWEAPSGKLVAEWRAHPALITCITYSPDGSRIFSGAYDATVGAWNRQPLSRVGEFRGHALPVRAIAVSPNGECIASGSIDETVRVWESRAAVRGPRHVSHGLLNCICFSPDGSRIAGGDEHLVHIWDAESGHELAAWQGHAGAVNSVAFSPDGERIASGSTDRTIHIWDVRSGSVLAVLHGHENAFGEIAFTPDGNEIQSIAQDGRTFVWNAISGEKIEQATEGTASKKDTSQRFPLVMIKPRGESEVQHLASRAAVAWHPERLWSTSCHSSGRLWAGGVGGSLRILKLEDLETTFDMSGQKLTSTDEMFDVINNLHDTIAAAEVRYASHKFSQQKPVSRKSE